MDAKLYKIEKNRKIDQGVLMGTKVRRNGYLVISVSTVWGSC